MFLLPPQSLNDAQHPLSVSRMASQPSGQGSLQSIFFVHWHPPPFCMHARRFWILLHAGLPLHLPRLSLSVLKPSLSFPSIKRSSATFSLFLAFCIKEVSSQVS